MAGKILDLSNKNCESSGWDSDDYEEAKDNILELSIDKLNLGPKKKLLVLSPSRLLVHRAHRANNATVPQNRMPDAINGGHLEPNGELAKYLEGLAEAEDVQSYVKENAFGQPPVNSSHPDWGFYSKVLNALKIKQQN